MREIKFRGLRLDNKEWTCGDLIQLLGPQGGGRKFIVDNRFGACIDQDGNFVNTEAPFVNEVDPDTVGQYTVLKDKNGKEIYEGDIGYCSIRRYKYSSKILAIVKCELCFWSFWEMEKDILHEIWPNDQFEVVGNIHEHPNLLGGNQG